MPMYLMLRVDLKDKSVSEIGGDENFRSQIDTGVFSSEVLPYLTENLEKGINSGGKLFSFNGRMYRMIFSLSEIACDVLLIDGNIDFDDVEKFTHDNLTNLLGKYSLFSDLEKRKGVTKQCQLILLDIDSFRRVNTMVGREGADSILLDLTKRISEELISNFTLYRFEGDSFAILREGRKLDKFIKNLQKLLDEPFVFEGKNTYITMSIGSIELSEYPEQGAAEILESVQAALTASKTVGKGVWSIYSDDLTEKNYRELEMEGMIRDAIKNNEFILHYQPQYSFAKNKVVGAEALIRWNHPEKGLVSPAEFIPVAERSGLVVNIGEWVVREACRQQKEWLDKGLDIVKVGVNIGSLHFNKPNFISEIKDAISDFGIQPDKLGLEITEGSVIEDVTDMIVKLEELRNFGVHVSIDDFGTGYSSLSYLKKFKIDTLKIDQSFVLNMTDESDDIAIVKAIIDLAKNLNIKVIAEGVETDTVKQLLIDMDCTDMQGYLVSRPIPYQEFEKKLFTLESSTKMVSH